MFLPQPAPPCFAVSRWIFARALGLIFFFAFASLGPQIRGLAGAEGIVPTGSFLNAAYEQLGFSCFWQVPTLCWLSGSDAFLVTQCLLGVAVSVALMIGLRPGLCAFLLWALYLSLVSVCGPFLSFQWDALLLETAFLAIFYLPWRRPNWRRVAFPSRIVHWLLWWLLFRLMFESGVVKLASRDINWRDFSALSYHFETQPLPLWTAWYAHHLPNVILALGVLAMFAIELIAPWMIIAAARLRHVAAWCLIALQIGILLTGNYAFFNLLTIALCLLLFEDSAWPQWLKNRTGLSFTMNARRRPVWMKWAAIPAACCIAALTAIPLFADLAQWIGFPRLVDRSSGWAASIEGVYAPLRSFNGYGLFAVMTTTRHEIVLEGSDDGSLWKEYEFPYKPGDVNQRPRLAAPFQPRLDWQMWFAALSNPQYNPWFVGLLQRLLEGSPQVTALLSRNPFPDHPPKFIRAVLYDYHVTNFGDSAWWKREPLGLYYPAASLKANHD